MPLTAMQVKNATKGERPYKLADGKGLFLFVTATGAKSWRMKYRFAGREKLLTFGLYPDVTLAEARDRTDAARAILRQNKDPIVEAQREREAQIAAIAATFKASALAWHEDEKPRWSPRHAKVVMNALERDVFPDLGQRPIADIDGPSILRALRKIERRGAIETAKRVLGYISAIYPVHDALVRKGAGRRRGLSTGCRVREVSGRGRTADRRRRDRVVHLDRRHHIARP